MTTSHKKQLEKRLEKEIKEVVEQCLPEGTTNTVDVRQRLSLSIRTILSGALVVPDREVKTFYDPDTGVVHCSFVLSPDELARTAAELYAAGDTHEEVTAFLERNVPDYKKVLCECFLEDGRTFWLKKPTFITTSLIMNKQTGEET